MRALAITFCSLLAASPLRSFDPRWLDPTPTPATASYRLALALSGQGKWSEAGRLFERLWREDGLLAPYHAYQAARCRLRRGDSEGALAWAARVERGSVPEAEARLVAIDALVALRRWSEAEAEARGYGERFPAGPRRAEAAFARARALEAMGRPAEAVPVYRRIWAEAPLEAWSSRADERLRALALDHPAASDWLARGMVFYERNQNEASEAAFSAALAATPADPSVLCRAHFHRAMSVWKRRQRSRAAPLFAEADASCRAAHDEDLGARALYQRARCLSATGDQPGAIASYAALEEAYPRHSYADDALLRSAEAAASAGDDGEALARLIRLPERYPDSDNVGEALWRVAWRAYQARDWAEVHHALEEAMRRVPRATVWYAEGRAEYWHGRAFDRQGDHAAAGRWYEQAVRRYPLSVYAWFALNRLAPPAAARLVASLRSDLRGPEPPLSFAPSALYAATGFTRALRLVRMGLGADAQRELAHELARLGPADPEREPLLWISAHALDRAGLWSASYVIPRYRLPDFRWRYPTAATVARWRLAYPRAFPTLVSANPAVPETLQLALMREESGFDPRAESTANCLGLTMLKPTTAQELFGAPLPRERLFDAATNISLGGRHLAALLARYRGSPLLAVAAYDGGEGSVARWLQERGHLPPDEFLELVPYDETRNYTKRVLASYFAYSWLYAARAPVPRVALGAGIGEPLRR